MASQVTDVVGHHRTNPERRELLGTHRSQERRNPDQECRPLYLLTLGGPRPGLGRLDVERILLAFFLPSVAGKAMLSGTRVVTISQDGLRRDPSRDRSSG